MIYTDAFKLGVLVDGQWQYQDPTQARLASEVQKMLGWDLAAFDAWLHSPTHWSGFPRTRQRLMQKRSGLSQAFQKYEHQKQLLEQQVRDYLVSTRRLALTHKNLPPHLREAFHAMGSVKLASAHAKLDATSIARIRRLYQEMVESGHQYGAQTKLAQQYGVSTNTIRKVLKG